MVETTGQQLWGTEYRPETSGALYNIRWGIRFFFSGFRMLARHGSLMGLSLVPIIFTIVALFSLAAGSAWLIGLIFDTAIFGGVRVLVQAAVFLIALVAGYFLYMPLARILLASLSETLSRRAHLINTGQSGFGVSPGWRRAMLEGVKLISFQALIIVAVIVIGLALPPAAAPAWFVLATFLAGLDFLDVPLSARGIPLGRKLRILWRNRSLAVGFGLAAHVMLIIPGLNIVLLPAGVIGATLLIDALEANGKLKAG